MDSDAIGTNNGSVRTQRSAGLEKTTRAFVWLLACIAGAIASVFVLALSRAHCLDAEMDVVAASLGGV